MEPRLHEEEQGEQIAIACLLPIGEQEERGEDLAELFKSALEVRELADGYAFRFQADDALCVKLLECINIERKCCPFFKFELVFEPQNGPTWLKIRGPQGVKEFISEGFAPAVSK